MEQGRLDKIEEKLSTLISMVGNLMEVQTETNDRLDRIEVRLDRVEERLDRVEDRLDKVEDRLDRIEVRLDKVEDRLDRIEVRLDKVENELDHSKKEQASMRTEIMTKLSVIDASQNHLWEKSTKNEREIIKIKAQL